MPVARFLARTALSTAAFALAAAAALGAACSRTPVDGEPDPVSTATTGEAPTVELAENFEATMWKLDPYTIDSAMVVGDTLRLVVRHGGGCRTHRFSLAASRAFRESSPVQVSAVLTHDADGDNCRALLTRDLRYDLTPLREAYRAAYGAGPGSIVIHLWHQGRSLRYDF